jgi:hypothetical protein
MYTTLFVIIAHLCKVHVLKFAAHTRFQIHNRLFPNRYSSVQLRNISTSDSSRRKMNGKIAESRFVKEEV